MDVACAGKELTLRETGPLQAPWNLWSVRFAWISLFVSIAIYSILLVHFQRHSSTTMDEAIHLASGIRAWQCGDFGINPGHPPLVKLVAAFPVRHWQVGEFTTTCGTATVKFEEINPLTYRLINSLHGQELIRRGRIPILVFSILLLVTIWYASWTEFGPIAAIVAVFLATFEPIFTAHGVLITTDMGATALMFLAVVLYLRWQRKPGWARLSACSVVTGLALAAKHSSILLLPIFLILMVLNWYLNNSAQKVSIKRRVATFVLMCLIAWGVLWSVYGFRFRALPVRQGAAFNIHGFFLQSDARPNPVADSILTTAQHLRFLPESYFAGFADIISRNAPPTFIFGKCLPTGVWYYFPVAIAIKTTISLLLMVLLSAVILAKNQQTRHKLWYWSFPALFYLCVSMTSQINIGVRHVLPIYPFLVVLAAGGATYLIKEVKWGVGIVAALLIFQAVSYVRAEPDALSYANEIFGGPRNVYKLLNDSNVDWGQALPAVHDYIVANNIHDCRIAWFGPDDPKRFQVPCEPLPNEFDHVHSSLPPELNPEYSGVIFIGSTLTNNIRRLSLGLGGFRQYRPDDVIAGSVLVYRGSFNLEGPARARHISRARWYGAHGDMANAQKEMNAAMR